MKQGDAVLIWGATGGIGGYATQYVLNGGGTPVGVVSLPARAELLHAMGCEHVIDRKADGYQFWSDEHTQDEGEWRRLGKDVRSLIGEDPEIVLEHPGRPTMGASVFIAAGRHGRHVRGHVRLHDRVRQPAPLDEAEEHRLRHFANYRRRGTPTSHRRRQGPAAPVAGVPARPRSATPRSPCTATRPRASSGCCAWHPSRASASTTRRSGPASARTASPCSSATRLGSSDPRRAGRRRLPAQLSPAIAAATSSGASSGGQ